MNDFQKEKLLFTPIRKYDNSIPLILAFPNQYTIGITSLGYQLIWAKLAQKEEVNVSRLFTDIQENLPRDPELLGFSFSWELDYVNILNLLEKFALEIIIYIFRNQIFF